MKQEKMNFAQISRTVLLLGLIVCGGLTATRAQVSPTVCFEPKPETFTRTATGDFNNTFNFMNLNQAVPHGFYSLVINPGGATEERFAYVRTGSSQTLIHPGGTELPSQPFQFNHLAGETLLLTAEGDAVFGYKNSSSTIVTIPRGVSSSNYFAPGNFVYPSQPRDFQPGTYENAVTIKVLAAFPVTWTLNNQQAVSNTTQQCSTITYQGRLSDAGNAANGQFDLQFQLFDRETGGAAQSGLITLENVQVTNGIFTVPLNFGVSLTNNFKARSLEIGVRPGSGSGNDPFSTLTPRQPITSVPYAINATNATNAAQLGSVAANQYVLTTDPRLSATNNTNFIQNSTTQQTANFNINGNGTIGGSLTVGGTLDAAFGQNVTTVFGANRLQIDAATTAYTLVPELTQTVNVPANSALFISTDGGIQSTGSAANSYSVIDVAIFVDGALVGQRRIVIANNPLPSSVGNWSLNIGQTLAAGSHTIEVRVRNGGVAGSTSAVVGGDSLLNGQLTVAVIKK